MKKNLKINYKWLVVYILLFFLAIFLSKNLVFFSSYLKNFSVYTKIDYLKITPTLNYTFLTGVKTLELPDTDKSNIFLLSKNFSQARSEIYRKNTFTYKDFYNLGNIYFLNFLDYFKKLTGDYVKLVQQANSNYSLSLDMLPSYAIKYPVIFNSNLAKLSVWASYVVFCDNLFLTLLDKVQKIIKLLDWLTDILKQQDYYLKKWYVYKDLSNCIDSLRADSSKNIWLVYQNKIFFGKVKNWLIYKMIDYVNNEDLCYQQKELINQKYSDSLISSLDYFNKFYDLQKKLLLIYKKADYFQMKYLCENKSKLSKKISKQNSKMEKNYEKLSDLANKPKPHRKNKNNPKQEHKQDKKQANKKEYDKNAKPDEKFNVFKQDIIKRLNEMNKHYIYQMINDWSNLKGNVYQNYIKKLFRKFNDVTKDYMQNKQESIGK